MSDYSCNTWAQPCRAVTNSTRVLGDIWDRRAQVALAASRPAAGQLSFQDDRQESCHDLVAFYTNILTRLNQHVGFNRRHLCPLKQKPSSM